MDDNTREQFKKSSTTIIGTVTGPVHVGTGNQYNYGLTTTSSTDIDIDTESDDEE